MSHLLIVTSEAHRWLEWSDIPDSTRFGNNILRAVNANPSEEDIALKTHKWESLPQYARSKLFVMYISESLATLARGSNGTPEVIVNPVCPGSCTSDLRRDLQTKNWFETSFMRAFSALCDKTAEQGGWSYVRAAALPVEAHGRWYKTTGLHE